MRRACCAARQSANVVMEEEGSLCARRRARGSAVGVAGHEIETWGDDCGDPDAQIWKQLRHTEGGLVKFCFGVYR